MQPDPYASHLPVLAALSETLRVRRVLEFGAGLYSTPFFLGLPDLERLVSVEVDPEWRGKVAQRCPDERLTIRKDRPDSAENFDLILIDDAVSSEDRAETIRWVLRQVHPTVVIHDADVPDYIEEIRNATDAFDVLPTEPQTAVVW